jgi:hypothetical protein
MDIPMARKLPVIKPAPLKHSLRTSLISALITAFLCMFFISGGRTTTAMLAGIFFLAMGVIRLVAL